ncbi:MAG: carboxylating nicotinate-nucleotide diphosphorylase [Pseudomonadales bacterium]|jgi:nicotinate-nucleotide pyrophosphorylase (carboxylating)
MSSYFQSRCIPAGVTEVDLLATVAANVTVALTEDVGSGDVSAMLIDPDTDATARIITRDAGILSGIPWVAEVCRQVDPRITIDPAAEDAEAVTAGQLLVNLAGPAASLLTAERTALNFLQLLSGTATLTAEYVGLIAHTRARLLDTRKTVPGLRLAQKYAVRCGGGENHRIGLYDQYLIKENHIAAAGSITAAVARARSLHPELKVEVEVEDLDQLQEAIDAGAEIAMVDNFSLDDTDKAAQLARGRLLLESSGGINRETIVKVAEAGVDYISVGELTKTVRPLDLSMRFETI